MKCLTMNRDLCPILRLAETMVNAVTMSDKHRFFGIFSADKGHT